MDLKGDLHSGDAVEQPPGLALEQFPVLQVEHGRLQDRQLDRIGEDDADVQHIEDALGCNLHGQQGVAEGFLLVFTGQAQFLGAQVVVLGALGQAGFGEWVFDVLVETLLNASPS